MITKKMKKMKKGTRCKIIEGLWNEITGKSWMISTGNIACMIYGIRSLLEQIPIDDNVFYGKIGGLGELVHTSELEVIK